MAYDTSRSLLPFSSNSPTALRPVACTSRQTADGWPAKRGRERQETPYITPLFSLDERKTAKRALAEKAIMVKIVTNRVEFITK